jgi:hypothetical protein
MRTIKTFGAAAVASIAGTGSAHAVTTALFEDFEDATVTYTTSPAEYSDGSQDYFTRTDGSNIGGESFTNVQGTSYFAAQDLNAETGSNAVNPSTQTFGGIDISGLTDLSFSAYFAEDDSADGNEDWDSTTELLVEAQIDGGGYGLIFAIQNDGTTSNTVPQVDINLDGDGEGAVITDALTEYSAAIAGTGNTLDLRITYDMNDGDEDIAIDNVRVTGIPEPASLALLGAGGLMLLGRRRRA